MAYFFFSQSKKINTNEHIFNHRTETTVLTCFFLFFSMSWIKDTSIKHSSQSTQLVILIFVRTHCSSFLVKKASADWLNRLTIRITSKCEKEKEQEEKANECVISRKKNERKTIRYVIVGHAQGRNKSNANRLSYYTKSKRKRREREREKK